MCKNPPSIAELELQASNPFIPKSLDVVKDKQPQKVRRILFPIAELTDTAGTGCYSRYSGHQDLLLSRSEVHDATHSTVLLIA